MQNAFFEFGLILEERFWRWTSGYFTTAVKATIVAGTDIFLVAFMPGDSAAQMRADIGKNGSFGLTRFQYINTIAVDRFFPSVDL